MIDPNFDIAHLSSRISALEKANRRWRMGGLFLFAFLVAAALLAGFKSYAQHTTTEAVPKAVAAHEFVLIGPHGRVMGRMTTIAGKPALEFYDSTGRLWWFAPPKMGPVPVTVK
jgi:hypothetical protein